MSLRGNINSNYVPMQDHAQEPKANARRFDILTHIKTLEDTEIAPDLPKDFIVEITGNIEDFDFGLPKRGFGSKIGLAAFKGTGVGYAVYRSSNTRLYPGNIMWLQSGSEQYIIAKPGLYYFPKPTQKLSKQVSLNEECITLGYRSIITVPPQSIGFASYNKTVYLLNPGRRYLLNSPLVTYLGSEDLTSHKIKKESVMLFQVQDGQFACVQNVAGHVISVNQSGRYLLRNPEIFLGVHSVTAANVEYSNYQRVFLQANELVFYQDADGETQYYDKPGAYELRRPAFFHPKIHSLYTDLIQQGSVTLIRLRAGEIACIQTKDFDVHVLDVPRKRYYLRAPEQLLGVYSVNKPRIQHGVYTRVRLQAGQMVFYQDKDGHSCMYDSPGTYELRQPAYFDSKIYDTATEIAEFESISRVVIRRGKISFKYDGDGHTVLMDQPGIHIIKRPEVFAGKIYDITAQVCKLGAFTLLNVPPGYVAVTYDGRFTVGTVEEVSSSPATTGFVAHQQQGHKVPSAPIMHDQDHSSSSATSSKSGGAKDSSSTPGDPIYSANPLKILGEGRHVLDHELWTLKEMKSIQEKRLNLNCLVYSRNRVAFAVRSFILYKVINPAVAFVQVENIEEELKIEAEATVLSIFGAYDSHTISQGLALHTAHDTEAESAADNQPPTYQEAAFAEVVRKSFQGDFRYFSSERGVLLTRMRVEHIDFSDAQMKVAVEKQAENAVRIEAERRNVEQESQTKIAQAEGEAAAKRITARSNTEVINAETEAKATKIREIAAAQAEASSNPLATQISLINAYAEGQAKVFQALSTRTSVIPTDISLSLNALPAQIAKILAGDVPGNFSVNGSALSQPSSSSSSRRS
eukprot:GCRY01002323.1.p1 GENE.GCRY01002323.1~~GCRY01002323.1.p1  ORF type:complete len:860 (+),score=274.15 GCRY01002323.1:121-2700(+)